MDDPTTEHIQGLLQCWLAPREILKEVQNKVVGELFETQLQKSYGYVGGGLAGSIWAHMLRVVTHGVPVEAPPTQPDIKIW